ncbi:MAG: glutaminyl-peptide cyclotransferase [Trueperaceae bacterium]|nr:glutaminyl-peptide cyclotransferase [Trueperaceae bacterium]
MTASRAARMLAAALTLALLTACSAADVARWVPEVVATHPHDPTAFTQGLLFHEGRFYESTGLYGRSDVREVTVDGGAVVRARPLDAAFFAEGLARVGDRLLQLTYREGVAFVYDLETFEELERFAYEGEGWGLCFDGHELWMSDGSSRLQRRDPDTFELLGRVDVRLEGRPVERLNELECVGDHVVANVWLTTDLVRIVKSDGRVDAVVDAAALVPDDPAVRSDGNAVLNGVAHDPETGRWWLTGKLWPVLYEVRFGPAN